MWQTRDEKRQTKRVPLTATISVDTSVIPNARAAELAAEQPAAQAAEGNEGLGEEPRQLDVFSKVQAAWTGSVSAIAADDVASASSILFGPDAVTLMAPGADSVTLATGKEKINLLNEFKASHVSLSVTVGEIAVLQDGDSKLNSGLQSYSALVRSNYTIANAQGVQVEQGKRMELWRPSAANGRDWHLSWSMWNDDGMCLARGK
ncbi:hypothetical protein CLOM_g19403 [Closterium sp. NIES-68]|nr:hypothetical protein CLOM_g19403 [Closterium sp. NIES-68]GJP76904.1 hypothetical protein CLOP_g7350 [Closterium sp. NIES-67]